MNDPLDLDLRDRLQRVSAAVPVDPQPLRGGAISAPVRAGATTRRLAIGGLAPILAVALVGTLFAGIASIGPSESPGASGAAAEVIAKTRSGDFELAVRSRKGAYTAGEAINIDASLTFLGQGVAEIRHASGASVPGRGSVEGPDTGGTGGPIGFGIVEPVLDDLRLGTGWDFSCGRSELASGQPLIVPFAKGGGWDTEHPRAAEFRAYVEDPVLRLTPGTWHVYAVAEFAVGSCSADQIEMRVDIEIEVVPAPAAASSQPPAEASSQPQPSDGPIEAITKAGDFTLTIRSPSGRYAAGEPIDVQATFFHSGTDALEIWHSREGSPLDFGIVEPVLGDMVLGPGGRLPCIGTQLEPGYADTAEFRKSGSWTGDDPLAEEFEAFFQDPQLRLSAGRWHVYAVARFSIEECGDPIELRAEIAIVVGDEPAVEPTAAPSSEVSQVIALRTASEPASGCRLAKVNGTLALDRESGLGLQGLGGETSPVTWPSGYTARHEPAGAVIIDPTGRVVARVGDPISWTGTGTYACMGIEVGGSGEPPIALETHPVVRLQDGTPVCHMALGSGVLALNPRTGLGFAAVFGGSVTDVSWPEGFSASYRDGVATLIDESGTVLAEAGDFITAGGGYGLNETFHACGVIDVD